MVVSIDFVYDDQPAHIGNLASGSVTNDATPTITGKATPNSVVEIFDNGVAIGSVTANARGDWSFTPATDLAEGLHSFTAVSTNPKTGAVSDPTAAFELEIDTTAPGKPGDGGTGGDGIGDITDDVGPIQGSVKPGETTDDTTPTLEGSGLQPGDVVTIIDNGQPIGSAVADDNGGWQFTPDTPLNDGDHEFTIVITDPAGNESEPSDGYLVIIDTQAPAAPVIVSIIDDQGSVTGPINAGDTTDDAQPEIQGTAEAHSIVTIYDNGVAIGSTTADENGDWDFIPVPPLLNGPHDITAKAQDAAGNISDESNSIGFDLIAGGSATAPSIIGAWDDVEAFTGMLHDGALTNDARPELRGTAPAGDVVTLIMDGKVQGSVTADANGQWSWTPAADIADGVHNFRAEISDAAGNKASTGNFKLEIDTVPPAAADDVTAEDNVGPDVGLIDSGDTTDDSTPTIGGGGAEPGDTVIIKDGDDVIGSTVVGDDGSWEYTPDVPLEDGPHEIIVVIRDPAGNESDPSTPIDLIVDTSKVVVSIDFVYDDQPAHTGNLASGSVTNDATPTITGKATPNSVVEIFDNGVAIGSVTANARGDWSFTPATDLAEGLHSFTAVSTNPKTGAVSDPTAAFELEIDTTAPGKPGDGGTGGDGIGDITDDVGPIQGSVQPGGTTDDTTPTLEGSGLQPGDVVTIIDNGQPIGSAVADDYGRWQFTPDTPLNDGQHDFTIIVTDPAGNSSAESDPYPVIVDTQAPTAPAIVEIIDDQGAVTGPIADGATTDDAQPEVRGTASPGSIVIIYDHGVQIGSTLTDSTGSWTFTPSRPMGNGAHSITAREMDKAGNLSDASDAFSFDVTAGGSPAAPAITGITDDVGTITGNVQPGGITDDNLPTVHGTADPGTIVTVYADGVALGSVTVAADGRWNFTPVAALADGLHNITAVASNAAGNTSPSTGDYPITVDTQAPGAIGSPVLTDDVGAITGPILSGDTTDDNTPTFSGTAEPGSTVIIKDNGKEIGRAPVDAAGDWSFTPSLPLPDGDHSFSAVVQDPAGNLSAESAPIDFVVDTSLVDIAIMYAVDNVGTVTNNLSSGSVTDDTTPTLVGQATPGMLVTIYQGTSAIGSVLAGANGKWTYEINPALSEGQWTFTATVTDVNGNESAPTADFVLEIDTTAPLRPVIDDVTDDVGIHQGTIKDGSYTDDSTPTLQGRGTAGDRVTVLDNGQVIGSAIVDANGDWRFTPDVPLNDGQHDFTIIATDSAGNSSASSDPWTVIVDTVAPLTPLITRVVDDSSAGEVDIPYGGSTKDRTPTYEGTAEPGSTLTLVMDGKEIASIVVGADGKWSWTPDADLSYGSHVLRVHATDSAGNSSTYTEWDLNILPPATVGRETFDNYLSQSIGVGFEFPSGFKLLAGATRVEGTTTGYDIVSPFLRIYQRVDLAFTVGKTTDVSFTLNGWGSGYPGQEKGTATAYFYDADNNLIGSVTKEGARFSVVSYDFAAPPGVLIDKIVIKTVDHYGLGLDNVVWGTKANSRSFEIMEETQPDATDISNTHTAFINDDSNLTEPKSISVVDHELVDLNHVINMADERPTVLNISLGDLLTYGEEGVFTDTQSTQLMIKGDEGDIVNLSDLLPDGTDPGNWAKAEGTVTVGGVQYEVYQHSGADTELLVQLGVQTNLNNH